MLSECEVTDNLLHIVITFLKTSNAFSNIGPHTEYFNLNFCCFYLCVQENSGVEVYVMPRSRPILSCPFHYYRHSNLMLYFESLITYLNVLRIICFLSACLVTAYVVLVYHLVTLFTVEL